jgi:hypothetical protein
VGVAVKITGIPAQTGFEEAEMLTPTGAYAVTIMMIVLDVAGLPVAQGLLEVSLHIMVSPLVGV